jgi:hypothetical protein
VASGKKAALSSAGTASVIREVTEAEFIDQFTDLIDRFDASIAPDARPEFAGAEAGDPHEHTTRVHFLDELIELLGWSLELGGNMAEEVRLKGETTTFMDYLGVRADTNAPALLIEAKAWDKAFPEPRKAGPFEAPTLLGDGINHWRSGGEAKDSPVAGQWHAYINQVGGYVKGLRDRHGHTLPRAVITSGQWIVVFVDPVQAFVEGAVEDVKIRIFKKQNFKAQASELFSLISKKALAAETPFNVRPTEVLHYLTKNMVVACFHAVHVSYEASGSPIFGRKPRVLIYPALVLRGADNMLLTVLEESEESLLEYTKDETTDELSLAPHIDKLVAGAAALLARTGEQLDLELQPAPVVDFPGFPRELMHKPAVTRPLARSNPRERDNWIIVTGQATHFVKAGPDVDCRFHKWSVCNVIRLAAGPSAVSRPVLSIPRALFIDETLHHCAHRDVVDRKEPRCQIHMIDASLCCRGCTFVSNCWPGDTRPSLPCGT